MWEVPKRIFFVDNGLAVYRNTGEDRRDYVVPTYDVYLEYNKLHHLLMNIHGECEDAGESPTASEKVKLLEADLKKEQTEKDLIARRLKAASKDQYESESNLLKFKKKLTKLAYLTEMALSKIHAGVAAEFHNWCKVDKIHEW